MGHFNEYKDNDLILNPRKTSREFTNTLKEYGYDKIKHNGWNNRPTVYKKH